MAAVHRTGQQALPPIVLLVSAHGEAADSYIASFQASGFWITRAGTIGEAVQALEDFKPDLVIADGITPRAESIDFIEAVRRSDASRRVPIILVSHRAADEPPVETREQVQLCLRGPVPPETLLQQTRTLIDRARSLRSREHPQGPRRKAKPCPGCGRTLEWAERGRLDGSDYDYYRRCESGCGLYCYDRDARDWVKLA